MLGILKVQLHEDLSSSQPTEHLRDQWERILVLQYSSIKSCVGRTQSYATVVLLRK
jgi:hypothetical protein